MKQPRRLNLGDVNSEAGLARGMLDAQEAINSNLEYFSRVREAITTTPATVGAGAIKTGEVEIGKAVLILTVKAFHKSSLRLYGSAAERLADTNRLLDMSFSTPSTLAAMKMVANLDTPASKVLYYWVKNEDVSPTSLTFEVLFVNLET